MSGDSAVTAMDTAETAQKTHTSDKVDSKEIELQILAAMRFRVTYLRDKADSITLESVRRLLEEDMGMEKYALDVHKSFVKEHLVQCIEDAGNDDVSENSQVTERKDDAVEEHQHEANNDEKDETCDEKDDGIKEALMSDIRRALRKRSSYIKANSEEITLAKLRRLLEEDLELEKHSLDLYKKFINEELDDVLQIHDAPKRLTESTGKNVKTKVKSTPSKKVDTEENSDSDAEGDVDDKEVAVKKTIARKRKSAKSEMTGKRKCKNDKSVSGKKKAKHSETDSENDSDAGDHETVEKKPLKRQTKETTPAVYGKRVEHLKSVIKSCGMSVPPSIYKKAKQAPEEKREATLIEELEQILAKEGLSSVPSEKEIKEVKKRKTISKELEGIDTSNIVSSSRRRSTTSFAPPPKPKITVESESESESDEPEDSENEEDNKEEEEEGNEEPEEGSQSKEESNNEDDGGEESE